MGKAVSDLLELAGRNPLDLAYAELFGLVSKMHSSWLRREERMREANATMSLDDWGILNSELEEIPKLYRMLLELGDLLPGARTTTNKEAGDRG